MNINLIYPSKYVKAADLGDKHVTVTIKSATMEELGYGAEKERKLVIYFEKATKGLILNRTNAMIIGSMYTPETDNWIGNAIILYSLRVKAFGSWHDAVRVKEQVPPRNVGASKMPDAMQEAPPIDDEDDVLDVDEGDEPSHNAPQATQTHVEPQGGITAHNPTTRTVDAATGEIMDTNGDVLFMPDAPEPTSANVPTDDELAITATWRGPSDAQAWAISTGACANKFHATESWLVSVRECGGYSSKNQAAVFVHFARRQQIKLEQREMVVA